METLCGGWNPSNSVKARSVIVITTWKESIRNLWSNAVFCWLAYVGMTIRAHTAHCMAQKFCWVFFKKCQRTLNQQSCYHTQDDINAKVMWPWFYQANGGQHISTGQVRNKCFETPQELHCDFNLWKAETHTHLKAILSETGRVDGLRSGSNNSR